MIRKELFNPRSIVVVGASNNIEKPGGKLLKNLLDHSFTGSIHVVNPNRKVVQGLPTFQSVNDIPNTDLAILAIPAQFCAEAIDILVNKKSVKAFIIISAGFGETSEEGKQIENKILSIVNKAKANLIGPNCIGVLTPNYAGVFTTPIPHLFKDGVDFISGSGATAVFIMESAIPKGLHFHNVISVGNSTQIGIEEVLEYLDESFAPEESSKIKLLYIENIANPDKLLKHARSLIEKGCQIAAIKAGSTNAGSRAALSHTGAMANSDLAVNALFRKAGIVRCDGREELTTVACAMMCKPLKGKNIAIITHAGGPAVMLSDALEKGGLKIPQLQESEAKEKLKSLLPNGASVENPIDFLATGTEKELNAIIDTCENDFDEIDAMAIIYGSPGLFPVHNVYKLLNEKMQHCNKPIYPILPSVINVRNDLAYFLRQGNVNFPDEVLLGRALTKIFRTQKPAKTTIIKEDVSIKSIKDLIQKTTNGYQSAGFTQQLFQSASLPLAQEKIVSNEKDAVLAAQKFGYPLAMKVVGPLHKTDVNGVSLDVKSEESIKKEFQRLMKIEGTTAVSISKMYFGTELFLGAKYEPTFGHVILFGLGGIFVETINDLSSGLAPLSINEAYSMIKSIQSYKILKGYRNKKQVNIKLLAEILVRFSTMLRFATEIKEIDINPMIANGDQFHAVDVRVNIQH